MSIFSTNIHYCNRGESLVVIQFQSVSGELQWLVVKFFVKILHFCKQFLLINQESFKQESKCIYKLFSPHLYTLCD